MSDSLVKTNLPGYYKDGETGAVINTNYTEYEKFLAQKNQYLEYLKTKRDISELKSELEELKKLLLEKVKNV